MELYRSKIAKFQLHGNIYRPHIRSVRTVVAAKGVIKHIEGEVWMEGLMLLTICVVTVANAQNCTCSPKTISKEDFCKEDFVSRVEVKSYRELQTLYGNYREYEVIHKRIYRPETHWLPKLITVPIGDTPCSVELKPSNNNNLPTTIIALGEGNPCGVKLELKKHYLLGDSLRILNSDAEQFQPKYTEKRTRTQTQQYTENWKHLRQMLAVE
ncbi:hypothetical protein ANCCEY_06318 [Ancylostoma ceylanicum]|uniref:NTR domain-containing protein n=1 Tax=Ancylostoma ceylanicum TaxID=53326 RepID=A0A0D6LTS2_9BILA|nr:hypothetical protein ANCCEY_06318 [Ancylostoma ceylanicum]